MKYMHWSTLGRPFFLFFLCVCPVCARGGDLDTIGATLLWQVDPTLKAGSVRVAHVEGTVAANAFEVNPAAVGQDVSLVTWVSSNGSAANFPNSVGLESWHANLVAANFYGLNTGPAPLVSHVDNYDADYFYNNFVGSLQQPSIPGRIVNQSFTFMASDEATVNPDYDNYAARYGTIFSSGVGNGGSVLPPGTCYNGLGVGIYGSPSGVGPTSDGRCKPDLVAPDAANFPNGANSYSIPYVSGSAAVLVQAATRGDGGPATTNAAADLRTIKALLLNGAIKPSDWINSSTSPLDFRYGAGLVDVFNAWSQLRGGQHAPIESTSNSPGSPHPPGTNLNNEVALTGWDFASITNKSIGINVSDQVNHYYFLVTNVSTLTATLVWNKPLNKASINDLNLFLYDTVTSNLVASSVSPIDNVEEIFVPALAPGRYDLQVQKAASTRVSLSETYALAFEFFSVKLNLTLTASDLVLTWPLAPTGFRLFSTSTLASPVWLPVGTTVSVSNGQNVVTLPTASASLFFRLQRP
ncbi:MAG TPA: hypothetical protein VJA21_33460 [Verrucomicrobiae bacterium]